MNQPAIPETTLDAASVAAYLRRHPSFLSDYPELASQLTVGREQGPVASLATYQLQHLREKNAALEQRLAELITIAQDNAQLMERVHALNLALIRAGSTEEVVRALLGRLRDDFHSEQVRLVSFGHAPTLPAIDDVQQLREGATDLPELSEFLQQSEPLTGRLGVDKLRPLFGDQAADVHSAALVRLDTFGLLAIGSSEDSRFQPGLGTVFLKMIGSAIVAALTRTQARA